MARNRQLSQLTPGEYIATVTWTQKIANEAIERCAEHVGIKVSDKWVYVYPDADDAENVMRWDRRSNKSAQAYIGMSIEDMVRERVTNRVRNSTQCCYRGEGRSDGTHCALHTQVWIDEQVCKDAEYVRSHMVPEPDRSKIEAEHAAQIEKRDKALMAGHGEWRKSKSGDWCVYTIDHAVGDVLTVVRRNGTASEVRLDDLVGEDLYRVTPLPKQAAA